MGAGSGGGISGTSITGAGLRAFTPIGRAGFRPGFADRALLRFTLPAFRAFPPDLRAGRAFAMTAYATVGGLRRQPRRSVLKCARGDSTLPARLHDRPHPTPATRPTSTRTCS